MKIPSLLPSLLPLLLALPTPTLASSTLTLTPTLTLASPKPPHHPTGPTPPTLTLLFSANLTLGVPIDIGLTPFGEKVIVPITDGAFSGPRLQGKVVTGLVISLTGTQGTQRADATYVLHTNDGVNIVLTERAIIPYVEILFETGSANAKYAWLNNVTAWATGSEVGDQLALDFWEISA